MPDDEPEWIPLDENPHADDKRDILDPTGEDLPFRRLIWLALGTGIMAALLVLVLVLVL